VLYPGPSGPLNSIRWEIQRESLEDYEYLHLLTTRTAALRARLGHRADWLHPERQAMEWCRQVVPSLTATERDPARILAARRQIADAIVELDAAPLLLVETEPSAGATLYQGPMPIEVRGITEPGTTLKINGRTCQVGSNGNFVLRPGPGRDGVLRIEAEKEGRTKTVVKSFLVRN
jgi:hypothetical protein